MKKFLYSDFSEGYLHIMVLGLPFVVGLFGENLNVTDATMLITVIISIFGSVHSAREVYRSDEYKYNRRVKIEMIIVLLLLAVSLGVAVAFLCRLSFKYGYLISMIVYSISLVPYLIECFYIAKFDLRFGSPSGKNYTQVGKNEVLNFNVTAGNIN